MWLVTNWLSAQFVCLFVYSFVYAPPTERSDAPDAGGGAGQPRDRPGAPQEGRQRQPGRRGEMFVPVVC